MATVAAIGEEVLVRGYGLAGALVLPASGPAAVRTAWRELPADVSLVVLTRAAAAVIPEQEEGPRLVVVMT